MGLDKFKPKRKQIDEGVFLRQITTKEYASLAALSETDDSGAMRHALATTLVDEAGNPICQTPDDLNDLSVEGYAALVQEFIEVNCIKKKEGLASINSSSLGSA